MSFGNIIPSGVHEHFLKFIMVECSTGVDLYKTLKELNLEVQDIRGQGNDNCSNMKGHTFGVQVRMLKDNARELFVPHACQNYNLSHGDVAMCCPDAMTLFGIL